MSCQLSTINYQIMIKHIFKIIWAQRKSNGWILGELVIVMCALWFMMDKLWVELQYLIFEKSNKVENEKKI